MAAFASALSLIQCSYCGLIYALPILLLGFYSMRYAYVRSLKNSTRKTYNLSPNTKLIAFFHPFCASGGGGERVLWKMLHTMNELNKQKKINVSVVLYAAESDKTGDEILKSASQRFGIEVGNSMSIEFIFIPSNIIDLLKPEAWPRFTMIGQSIGSIMVAWYGLKRASPDTFIDTTGAAFTMPLAKLCFGAKCACYTHYPTISTDMLKLVYERRSSYNHDAEVASSKIKSLVKLLYYSLFALCYSIAGYAADIVMVNSTWTSSHIKWLWRCSPKPIVVYPPVAVEDFALDGLSRQETRSLAKLKQEVRYIVSVAQFRPEKDHELQLKSFHKLITGVSGDSKKKQSDSSFSNVRLLLLGSCRDEGDKARVTHLQALAKELGIEKRVDFVLNAPFSGDNGVISYLQRSSVGLHTMWNEHFGIGVVEMMAAGCIVVAHDSAGPQMDIVVPTLTDSEGCGVGYLATDVDSFAARMKDALELTTSDKEEILERALIQSRRFSDDAFAETLDMIIRGGIDAKHSELFR